jgi:hypothetical protein
MPIAGPQIQLARILRRAVAGAVLIGAAVPVLAADPLVGVWQGSGTQYPPGRDPAWTIVMTINARDGTIEYPSLSCGGILAELARDATSAQFRETITHGQDRCIDGGTITVNLVAGNLTWSYTGSAHGTQFTASAKVTGTLSPRPSSAGGPR